MNLRERIAEWIAPERRAVTVEDLAPMRGHLAATGESVSPPSAERVAAVYACVGLIAETVGSLPLHLYRRTDEGRERDPNHPLARLLHDAPNAWQSALEFRELMTAHVLLRGNAYAERIYSDTGRLVALNPIHPDAVTVSTTASGAIVYDLNGTNRRRLLADEVFHLRGRSDDSIVGRAPIAVARECVGVAQAQAQFFGDLMRNRGRPSGVLELPGRLPPQEEIDRIKKNWREVYGPGARESGGISFLAVGAKYANVSANPVDLEFIEQQRFSVEEIARIFRVPTVMIGAQRDANYSASVALAQHFATYTLRRHLVAWEQAIARQLLSPDQARTYYAEHALDGLLRADPKARADAHHLAIADGWMTVNEVRRLENLPPLPGGDVPTPRTLPGPLGLGSHEQPAPSRGT